jgi:hypothetical protein
MSRLLAKLELHRYIARRREGTDKLVSPARTKEIAKRNDSQCPLFLKKKSNYQLIARLGDKYVAKIHPGQASIVRIVCGAILQELASLCSESSSAFFLRR